MSRSGHTELWKVTIPDRLFPKGEELQTLSAQLLGWTVVEDHHIQKSFSSPDFRQELAFVNRAGGVAEDQGQHPYLTLSWGRVDVRIFTPKIDGLTESDFVLAAKINRECFW